VPTCRPLITTYRASFGNVICFGRYTNETDDTRDEIIHIHQNHIYPIEIIVSININRQVHDGWMWRR
jgi:hypothetical protein